MKSGCMKCLLYKRMNWQYETDIHAWYNMQNCNIEINTYECFAFRIDCNNAEEGLQSATWGQHRIDALALDNPPEYTRSVLEKQNGSLCKYTK